MDNSACVFWQVCISILTILLSSVHRQEFIETLSMDTKDPHFLCLLEMMLSLKLFLVPKPGGFMINVVLII